MPKTFIINIDNNYPFNLSTNKQMTSECCIKVIRSIPNTTLNLQKDLLQRILFVQNLRNKYLIKIQLLEEGSKGFQICYEFVKAGCVIRDQLFWKIVGLQLENLGQYLANIGVKAYLKPDRLCLNTEGLLKYYLGLQFQLNQLQQQGYLKQHYEREIANLHKQFNHQKESENRMVQYNPNKGYKQTEIMEKYRKASVATLPSKIPNLLSLNTQINKMKSVVQGINQYHFYGTETREVYQGRIKALSPVADNQNKRQLRKYSGDSKNLVSSNRKLSTKISDYKSMRNGKQSKQITHKSIVKYEGSQLKSKMEQMKYQEYIEITKSNKNYLNDFLSVLEDDFNFKHENRNSYANANETTLESQTNNANQLTEQSSAELLKIKAKESVQNSLRLIKKIKATC